MSESRAMNVVDEKTYEHDVLLMMFTCKVCGKHGGLFSASRSVCLDCELKYPGKLPGWCYGRSLEWMEEQARKNPCKGACCKGVAA